MTYNDLSKDKTAQAKPLVTPAPASAPETAKAAEPAAATTAETAAAPAGDKA